MNPPSHELRELRIKCAEAAGIKPILDFWAAYHPTKDSICFDAPTKREVEEWLARLPEGSWAACYVPTPFYRYPAFETSLDLCAQLRASLTEAERAAYMLELCRLVTPADETLLDPADYWNVANATAAQHCAAFLATKGKATGGNE